MPKTQLVCCVKDEGPFMLEWVAHHVLLGFDDILIFSNDCTDGTVELLNALQDEGLCRQLNNPVPPNEGPQPWAYKRHKRENLGAGFDHIMVIDADEFLNIHVGDHTLAALLAALPGGPDLLCLNIINFGASGRDEWEPGCVTEQFQMAMAEGVRQHTVAKSLVLHPDKFGRLANHHPERFLGNDPLRTVNAALTPVPVPPADYGALWRSLRNLPAEFASHQIAQINHYCTKTPDSYRLRQARGRGAVAGHGRHTDYYYQLRNENLRPETSIARYRDALAIKLAQLRAIPAIQKAEAETFEAYRISLALLKLGL